MLPPVPTCSSPKQQDWPERMPEPRASVSLPGFTSKLNNIHVLWHTEGLVAVGTAPGHWHPWPGPRPWVLITQSCSHARDRGTPATGEPMGGWHEAPVSPRGGGSWGWPVMKAGFGV